MNEKKIHVAYVVNSILIAGAEMTVFETAAHLDRERFSPTVYALSDYGNARSSLASRFQEAQIPLVFLDAGKKVGIISAIRMLRTQFHVSRPDILHCHLPDAVIAGGIAAASMHIPFIIHEDQTQRFHSWKIRLMYRLLRPFSALTVCYADSIEEDIFGVAHVLDAQPEKIEYRSCTISNGIDVARVEDVTLSVDRHQKRRELGWTDTDIVIVSTARFIEWKGHRQLVEAFASVVEKVPNARLFIAGGGAIHQELCDRVSELGLTERVQLPGVRTDIYEILTVADIFSLAFIYGKGREAEAIGIAGFEAMACGLPIVVSDYAGALQHTENGKNGIIVRRDDKEALSAALTRLAGDATLRQQMGESAHHYALRHLDWRTIVPIYERIYSLLSINEGGDHSEPRESL